MWRSRILPIVGHLFGFAVHRCLVHLEPGAGPQVVCSPTIRVRHILVILFRSGAHSLRCRLVRAHKWPDVTALSGHDVPFSGPVLELFSVLRPELHIALHLQLVLGHGRVPPVRAHLLGRPVRRCKVAAVLGDERRAGRQADRGWPLLPRDVGRTEFLPPVLVQLIDSYNRFVVVPVRQTPRRLLTVDGRRSVLLPLFVLSAPPVPIRNRWQPRKYLTWYSNISGKTVEICRINQMFYLFHGLKLI